MDCQPYVNNIEPEFRAKAPELQNGPVTFRSIRDAWYIVLLLIIIGVFIGLSIYTISEGWTKWNKDNQRQNQTKLHQDRLSLFVGVIVGMFALSLLLSIFLLLFWRFCPSAAINITMLGMTVSLLAFALVCFRYKSIAGGVVILVILFIFLIMLCCCFSKHAETADSLIFVTQMMLKGAQRMIAIPTLIMTLISFVFSSLLALSYAGIAQMTFVSQISSTIGYVYYVAIGTMYILIAFFMYYGMSYLMGTAASFWYTQTEPSKNTIGLKWLFKYNLGSVTFVSFSILIVKLMQTIVYGIQRHWDSKCMRSCRCLSRCLSSSVSGLLHTLNNQGVIISSYTGQSLIGGAKLASVLVYSCYPLFNVVRVISNFLFYSGILFCVCFPTFVSILIAQSSKQLSDMSGIVGATVFLTCILTSVVLLSTTFESLSALFLMFTLDYKLSTLGVRALSCHKQTKDYFQVLRQRFMPISIPSPTSNNFAIE